MTPTARKRPWLAALLAFVHPGLGHVYLREWLRAVMWFALVLVTASLVVPESAVPSATTLDAIARASRRLPVQATASLLGLTLLSMADAYWTATRNNRRVQRRQDQTLCPACGREVDEDLEFCHWCTTRLDEEPTSR